jgi:pimeloyl-ACP methyl ester carboxylesterase
MRLVLLALVASSCAAVQFVPLPPDAEQVSAPTDDGWHIALVRYRPIGKPTGAPVILCHGISANARNMDLDEAHSMARYFAAHGREAWTMSLRGTGDSDRPDEAKGRHAPTFDDFWKHDLPAVIATVRERSGATTVDYVGHSMGGMTVYAYLSQGGQGLGAVTTMGSPTRLDWGTGVESLADGLLPFLSKDAIVPSALGSTLAAPFASNDDLMSRFFYNPQSTNVATWQRLMAYGVADTSGGVAHQLYGLMKGGRFVSLDGVDLRAGLATVSTPVLVVAGRLDRIALSPAVRDGYDALGGPKEWLLITRANGTVGDYGHMDLVIGERAGDEVWVHVLDFLNRHARKEY